VAAGQWAQRRSQQCLESTRNDARPHYCHASTGLEPSLTSDRAQIAVFEKAAKKSIGHGRIGLPRGRLDQGGLVQLTAPKGTIPRRLIGWSWDMLMLTVAVSSLFIQKIRMWGPWSPIHLLSILVLVTLPLAVIHARHDIAQHRIAMLMLFTGALVIAGGFTFLPSRIMHAVLFSQSLPTTL
jgi:uncharacterized membrane protein